MKNAVSVDGKAMQVAAEKTRPFCERNTLSFETYIDDAVPGGKP